MSLFRAIYSSRPFGFEAAILNGILLEARRANERDGITGALICREDIYLQWLEGPEDRVRDTLARIQRDDRHVEMTLHVAAPVEERVFSNWAMLHDPAVTWIWSQKQVSAGIAEQTAPEQVTGFFMQLRDQVNEAKS
ncbi:blue light sensor protein [Roseivivax halodurans JCM 10272]|uniref:Blue light sensor protein n=1 Tax=Roseivivax halodurans JCM 10272 TaxID=1449350 RepID=X7E2Y4_9RHOB|nr:BLUF domain-containing protein [Roseivivax halodurans]ETX10245.1 blue light sensor protein [Roseivivax halodurans JCM 10272]